MNHIFSNANQKIIDPEADEDDEVSDEWSTALLFTLLIHLEVSNCYVAI